MRNPRKLKKRPKWGPWIDVTSGIDTGVLTAMAGTVRNVRVVRNDLYQVIIREVAPKEDCIEQPPNMVYLSIKANDQSAKHDWRHFQRIKNELVGEECEAVELYPAQSRCVDASNQYHLFVFSDPTFRLGLGFNEQLISDDQVVCAALGSKQRPFEEDWPWKQTPVDLGEVQQKIKEAKR